MSTPDPRLSDSSDAEDLFASPSRTSKQTKKPSSKPSDTTDARPANRSNGPSKYDTEQTRNALLQKELEGVRGINEVIEGVISSLECAKGNMEVSISVILHYITGIYLTIYIDSLAHRYLGVYSPKHLDTHSLPDRTQPALALKS